MNKLELAFYFRHGSILTLESGEKRERIEGISITGAIIDESSDQLPGLFDLTVLPAMSQVADSWVWRVGVPKSNGIGGQDFKETCEKYHAFSAVDEQYAITLPHGITRFLRTFTPAGFDSAANRSPSMFRSW